MKRRGDTEEGVGTVTVAMDDEGGRFLERLRELGYLDPPTESEVLDRITERVDGVARFEDVRRMAAEVLFERQLELDQETLAFLDEEWRAIFH